MYLLTIHIFSSVKCLKILAVFYLGCLSSYNWTVRCIYVFLIPVICQIYILRLFSPSLWLAFSIFMGSFEEFLILMKSRLSVILFYCLCFLCPKKSLPIPRSLFNLISPSEVFFISVRVILISSISFWFLLKISVSLLTLPVSLWYCLLFLIQCLAY